MKTVGNLVDEQMKTSFDSGYDEGYEAGIMQAVRMLRKGTPAEEPAEAEPIEDETEEYENIFTSRKSPIKHAKHHDFWKEHGASFAMELEEGDMTVSEAVEGAKKFGISYKAVKSKAARFGYGIKKNKFYKRGK